MPRVSCIHKTATSCTPSATIYATVAAWEASIDRATNGDETGVICDDVAYDEATVTIDAAVSGTSMIRLTANDGALFTEIDGSAAPNVRGDGTFRSGARFDYSGVTGHCLTVATSYVMVDHIGFIHRLGTEATTRSLRLQCNAGVNPTNIGVVNCTFEATGNANNQDAIYLGGSGGGFQHVLINGCSMFRWSRCAFFRQQTSSSVVGAGSDLVIVHCGGYTNRANDVLAALVHVGTRRSDDTTTLNITNNAGGFFNDAGGRESSFSDGTYQNKGVPPATTTWNGSHNFEDGFGFADIDGTDNTTDWTSGSANPSTVATTQTTGTYWVVSDLTAGTTTDFRPLDDAAGNAIIGAGIATASLPSTNSTVLDDWWDTVNGKGARDKRGYTFNPSAPDIGPYSFEDHAVGVDIPFIAQGGYIS